MKDARLKAVAKAVEARYPGARVVFEPWEDFEDPRIRWWLSILNVAPKRIFEAQDFAREIGEQIYGGWERRPFYAEAMDRRTSRRFLARWKAQAAASRRSRRRRAARTKTRRPAASRRRAAG